LILRRYQQLALEAFEADRAAGRRHTYVVAPPGSGKTVMGLEMARRLGRPALVLCPTAAIQSQWQAAGAGLELTALTYQALCQTADPDGALRAAAEAQLGPSAPSRRRDAELARAIAALKKEVARGGGVRALLAPGAVDRVDALRDGGIRTVILDECHHLVSMWGYLVRAVLSELGPEVHVIGLTATAPDDMTADEAELYTELLGPIDFHTPTPAVVREGFLAPFQELALFTTPLDSELEWLRARHERFRELLDSLIDVSGDELSFPVWVSNRMRYRGAGDAEVPFGELLRRQPALARAGLRYLAAADLPLPEGAPRGERFRVPPAIEDWIVLLEDYALRCLRQDPSARAQARLDDLAVGLADLGFALTRTGIRPGRTDIDRVLVNSSAKPIIACEALAAEHEARGDALRAVVLVDSEHPPKTLNNPQGFLAPLRLGGGGRGLLEAVAADIRLAPLRPVLVTGESFVADGIAAPPTAREWVALATEMLRDGRTQCLIATRALLGEGWDAPAVNVLVDATSVAASISTRQMRGRTLRLDPADPEKLASNWDLVCVAPGLERGVADYARFVRRHEHLHAPCEDGSIESGISHVHPELSPYAPPGPEHFPALNALSLARARDRDAARARWRIGEPYRAVELPALLVRSRRGPAAVPVAIAVGDMRPAGKPRWWLLPAVRRRRFPATLPLPRVARAVTDAYLALDELSPEAAASLAWQPRAEGYVRCLLPAGSPEENARFATALAEAVEPAVAHRYVVARPLGAVPYERAWHPVPSDFGRNRQRADAYAAAFARWLGPGEMRYVATTEEGREALAAAAGADAAWETHTRQLWL
jgi:superfamily II DNA or RNA helicase